MKKLVALFLVAGFIAFLFGCSNGNSWYMIEDNPEPKAGIIDEHGQLPAPIRFDSGAKLETTEDNTLVKNVVVNVTETKSYDTGRNPIGTPEYIYIYGITAKLVDSLGASTEVSSLEKPFKLTLPAGHLGNEGICYAGVREDKSSPWKYTRLSENGITTLSQRSIRASGSGIVRPSYELSLYKMGVEIALFVYNKPPEEAQKDISGAGITATPTTSLLTLDEKGNYLGNLDMDIKLAGDNLSSLRDYYITVSIIYRSQKNAPAKITINKQPPQKTETKSDEAVSGQNRFVHIVTLNRNNFKAFFGSETSVNFTLDLKDISSSDFPTDFIIEINSVDNVGNLIPFSYSEKVSFSAEAVYTISYDLDGGSLAEGNANPGQYTAASESFTLKNPVKEGYTFAGWTGTDLEEATSEVVIEKGSTGDREYKATWNQNASDTYTLTVVKGTTGIVDVLAGGIYEAGQEITLEYTLEDGYEFASWISSEVNVDENNKFIMPSKDVNVTANAKVITYNIGYEGLEGADEVNNPLTYDVTSATITLNNPTKAYYTFKGWSGDGLEGDENLTVTIAQGSTGDKTYMANWTLASYTITYNDIEGATFADGENPVTYNVESEEIKLKNPTKENYTFKGWSGDGLEGDTNLEVIIAQGSTGDKSYTANWTPVSFAIAYNLNGGSLAGGVDNPTSYDITSATITLISPTKANYDFLGWTGTGIEEGTASMTVTIPHGSTGERSYVASWTLASVIIFNLSDTVTLEMRRCPAGSFVRQIAPAGFESEGGDGNIVHITKDFYMGTYEITNAQYREIMDGANPSLEAGSEYTGNNQPVVYISWLTITADDGFIDRMNSQFLSQLPSGYKFALPTEAQWEYACRAGTTTDFNNGGTMNVLPSGEDTSLSQVAWYTYNSGGKTHNGGELASNSFGLCDMHGNVGEWCADRFGDYSSTDLIDPTGPAEGSDCVVRGGGCLASPDCCVSWVRFSRNPEAFRCNACGFRLALVQVQEDE